MSFLISFLLIILSGLFSGLTLGFFSLNKTELERKARLNNKQAKKILSVRKNPNLLLCTLLIGNVAVNSALSIILGSLLNGLVAGIIATSLIVIFGEIFPQAVVSRFAMSIGSKSADLIKFFIILLYPLAAPLAWLLDKILGTETPTIWSRAELKEIIKFHEDSKISDLNTKEEQIILGALSFSKKKVKHIMTPKNQVLLLSEKTRITPRLLIKINQSGYSRIPVYRASANQITSILFVKDLLQKSGKRIDSIARKDKLIKTTPNTRIGTLLNTFAKKRIHIAPVIDSQKKFLGVITMEDIIEEVFRFEIQDESDPKT
ncbi:MAG: DUF21 domain-containing protein [Candidatus Moranbacteria bacterium]|nr:DUF21 domain-containing protein [Candidatus Moranbacteria bacterium]